VKTLEEKYKTLIEAIKNSDPTQLAKLEDHMKKCKECQEHFSLIFAHWAVTELSKEVSERNETSNTVLDRGIKEDFLRHVVITEWLLKKGILDMDNVPTKVFLELCKFFDTHAKKAKEQYLNLFSDYPFTE